MTVHVIQDGIEFTGEVEAQGRNGSEVRLTVTRPDGVKVYVYPERPDVSVTDVMTMPDLSQGPTPVSSSPGDPPIQPVGAPHQPLPMQAPAAGTSIAGAPLIAPHPVLPGRPLDVVSDLLTDPTSKPPAWFIVQSPTVKGRPKLYHTRADCPRVSEDAPRLSVDVEAVDFFDLSRCQACERRDKQMTLEEALHGALSEINLLTSMDDVRAILSKLRGYGFSISPQAVDR